jgi:hypothetical protein
VPIHGPVHSAQQFQFSSVQFSSVQSILHLKTRRAHTANPLFAYTTLVFKKDHYFRHYPFPWVISQTKHFRNWVCFHHPMQGRRASYSVRSVKKSCPWSVDAKRKGKYCDNVNLFLGNTRNIQPTIKWKCSLCVRPWNVAMKHVWWCHTTVCSDHVTSFLWCAVMSHNSE